MNEIAKTYLKLSLGISAFWGVVSSIFENEYLTLAVMVVAFLVSWVWFCMCYTAGRRVE